MRWHFFPFFLLASAVALSPCLASLTFENTQIDVHLTTQETNAIGIFSFTNTGTAPVAIKSVKTSCSCTTAISDKMFYAPGEKGKITAVYKANGQPGSTQKGVLVESDDPDHPISELKLRVVTPELAILEPASISWALHESPKPKVIKIHINDPSGIEITHVTSANPRVSPELKTIVPNKEYEISLLPNNTDAPMEATLIIVAKQKGIIKTLQTTASVASTQ